MVVATVSEEVLVWKFSREVELDSLEEEVVVVELVPLEEEEEVLDHVEGLEIWGAGVWVRMGLGL